MTKKNSDLVKVKIRLTRDESDYPPVDYEHIWARKVRLGYMSLTLFPSLQEASEWGPFSADIQEDDELLFSRVVRLSDHATLRVIIFKDSPDKSPRESRVLMLRSELSRLGCTTELSQMPGLIAVDIPEAAIMPSATKTLSDGEESGLWEYEEAALPRQRNLEVGERHRAV